MLKQEEEPTLCNDCSRRDKHICTAYDEPIRDEVWECENYYVFDEDVVYGDGRVY